MMRRAGFRRDIQGLRAIAVLAVVAQHAGATWAPGGFIGVDVFFVVSGFLITSLLVRELAETGRIDLPAFTARRARRILPAALVVVVLTVVGAYGIVSPLRRETLLADAVASALFVPNYAFAVRDADYFGDETPSLFQHYWSLGVEEQWYLVCPALLLAAWAVGRRLGGRRGARGAVAVALGIVLAGSLAAVVALTPVSQPWAFFALWTRMWEFAVGALIALVPAAAVARIPGLVRAALGWAGLAGILAAIALIGESSAFPGVLVLLPVLSTGAVILAGIGQDAPPRGSAGAVIGSRPFVFVGEISFSLYLVHWPLIVAGALLAPGLPWLPAALGVASIPVAWALFRLVEQPTRRARVLVDARPRRTLLSAAGATAAVALAAGTALAVAPEPALATQTRVAHAEPAVPPEVTPVVPANLEPGLADAPDDESEVYDDGCNLGYQGERPRPCSFGEGDERMVLWGDSHAAHWVPGVLRAAEERGMALTTHTKSRCSSALARHVLDGSAFGACDRWRSAVLDELREDPPEVLVLANYADEEVPGGVDAGQAWRDGLREVVDALPETRVLLLADTPDLGTSPLDCLAMNLEHAAVCAVPESEAVRGAGRDAVREVARETRAEEIDLLPYFCAPIDGAASEEPACAPILGGLLVYRDSHHLTATFAEAMGGALAEAIDSAVDGRG
ncbi:acyltransferase family protein [Microbacterium sp. KNMS]